MSRKERLCGVYVISTPNGSKYVGSSHHIYQRWAEHRSCLKRKVHHSKRLQMAWDKHNGNLLFEIYELCAPEDLQVKEQQAIDLLKAGLNTTAYVANVWTNPETKEKLRIHHQSKKWKEDRSKIATETGKRRWVSVDCSDGRSFQNLTEAAKAFGVKTSAIKHLILTQRAGKLGVKFKKSSDPWLEVISAAEQRVLTMMKNNTIKRSDEAKKKMSEAAKKKIKAPRNAFGQFTKGEIK